MRRATWLVTDSKSIADSVKHMMQVEGKNGFPALVKKVKTGGVPVLYHGALAASAATFVGHYPWFFTVSPYCNSMPSQRNFNPQL